MSNQFVVALCEAASHPALVNVIVGALMIGCLMVPLYRHVWLAIKPNGIRSTGRSAA